MQTLDTLTFVFNAIFNRSDRKIIFLKLQEPESGNFNYFYYSFKVIKTVALNPTLNREFLPASGPE